MDIDERQPPIEIKSESDEMEEEEPVVHVPRSKPRVTNSDGKIYRPNTATEERPEPMGIQYALPTERTVLPNRARQTDMTLLPAGMPVRGGSFLECMAHNNSWHVTSPDETLRHMAANELIEKIQQGSAKLNAERARLALEKAQSETNYARIGTLDSGHINKMTPKSLSSVTQDVLDKELRDQEVKFFMDDPMPSDDSDSDNDEANERGPGDYPCLKRLYDVNGKAYLRRYEMLRDASPAGHPDVEIVNKSHNDLMCQRLVGQHTYRYCSKELACICVDMANRLGSPEIAYKGREYKTPKELLAWDERRRKGLEVSIKNDGAVGLCYHDLKAAVHDRLSDVVRSKETAPEIVNPFAVRVGEGEYASEVCWSPVDSTINAALGISGRFPQHLNNCIQYVPKHMPGGQMSTYLAEVNADFQPRLSQANMFLGTSSPLGMQA